ncbi:MAG: response regulator, partial [Fibrobacteres bacterium]|nr:response regulator [Fibrobacterota bacterium]
DTTLCQKFDKGAGFDLVVMDQNMPGMRGEDALAKIQERGWNTPILITSGIWMHSSNDQACAFRSVCDLQAVQYTPNFGTRRQAHQIDRPKSL